MEFIAIFLGRSAAALTNFPMIFVTLLVLFYPNWRIRIALAVGGGIFDAFLTGRPLNFIWTFAALLIVAALGTAAQIFIRSLKKS